LPFISSEGMPHFCPAVGSLLTLLPHSCSTWPPMLRFPFNRR
jgi:hypothetical protein